MTLVDLIALIFDNLGRRKARVALTAVGVVIGTAAVVILVSLGIGLQRNATESLWGIGDLTQIQVNPGFVDPGGGGGGPIAFSVGGPGGPNDGMILITDEALAAFAQLPGVESVIPRDWLNASLMMNYGRLEGYGSLWGVGTEDLSVLGYTAVQGTTALERGSVVIGAMVPNNFYDPKGRPGQEPPPPPDLYDQMLRFTLIKYSQDGVEIRKTLQVRVAGVLQQSQSEADWSIYMPLADVTAMNEWSLGRRINRARDGYNMAIVKVADPRDASDTAELITGMGFQAFTPQDYLEGINSFFVVLQAVFGGVGAIALLVAAIGIANTMAMAILERTREIGLMKALGATNRDVLSVFLGESAGIGFVGGLGGIAIGWGLGQIINVVVLAYLAAQAGQNGGPPPTVAVYTPVWLLPSSLIFATIIGLLSGLYPALRAANLIPVNALKYE